jgi:hypothetical protein
MTTMVADELKQAKPGPDFRALVEKAIALQESGDFAEAVATHSEAVSADGSQGAAVQELYDSYCRLHDSYIQAGRSVDFAEGILGLAKRPNDDPAHWDRDTLTYAAAMFVDAGQAERALELVPRMQELGEELNGSPQYRWYQLEILSIRAEAAVARADGGQAAAMRECIFAELEASETQVREECPGFSNAAECGGSAKQRWFRWLGQAYHNASVRVFHRYLRDDATALRLMKRAAELRDRDASEMFLAGLELSVTNGRNAALRRLRRAFDLCESEEQAAFMRKELARQPEFAAVRDDPEFLAALGEPQ